MCGNFLFDFYVYVWKIQNKESIAKMQEPLIAKTQEPTIKTMSK